MKKFINIIKPIGTNENYLKKIIKNNLNVGNIFLLEKLNDNDEGNIVFFFKKTEINKIKKEKIINKYKINLKIINSNKEKIIDQLNGFKNKKLIKINFNEKNKSSDFLEFEIVTNYNFNTNHLREYIKNFSCDILYIKRTKNDKFYFENAIDLNDIWKYNKKYIFLNNLSSKILKINNLVIGEFDLIHKGHAKLLSKKNISILTFLNNPSKNENIFNINLRIKNLNKFNIKNIMIFDIKKENIDPKIFIEKYLKKMNPKNIYVGSDFKFGKNAKGDVNLLKKYFNVNEIKKDQNHTTTKIKKLIKKNDFKNANSLLYKDFCFEGIIIKGKQLGRKLGFPTANIIFDTNFKFNLGSYGSKVIIDNKKYDSITYISKIESKTLVETYIFNFNKEIYGKEIQVFPMFFIRKPEKFLNLKDLIKNIKNDIKISNIERKKYGK